MSDQPVLVCIGGGPKALAVAAKAKVLRRLGLPAPRVVIIERHSIGANWTAAGGWTDGTHRLGTSPEKDLGFPYRSAEFRGHNRHVDHAMLAFSWNAYLVAAGGLGEWVDRGRPAPRHREWARYLQWAAGEAQPELVIAEARTATIAGERWRVEAVGDDGQPQSIEADALLVTGPGSATSEWESSSPRVFGPARFWRAVTERRLPVVERAAVIGAGETTGAILHEMCGHDALGVSIIAPQASIFTRGEGYFENRAFTDSGRWQALSLAQRRELISRADRGVISQTAMDEIRLDSRFAHVEGKVTGVQAEGEEVVLGIETATGFVSRRYDLVIDARGTQDLWLLRLLGDVARSRLELAVGGAPTLERAQMSIDRTLAISGMTPRLFVPGLAALRQGPGFPNLSCLGSTSDRICAGLMQATVDTRDPHLVTAASGPTAGRSRAVEPAPGRRPAATEHQPGSA
ncbi:MAG: SidA/IucD/PvdA family monooxygenase [Actinomycetota bacterium]